MDNGNAKPTLDQIVRSAIMTAYEENDGSVAKAAVQLDISPWRVYRLLRKFRKVDAPEGGK
jgi:transcriptional regulator of acetoin/glycerol metabolism